MSRETELSGPDLELIVEAFERQWHSSSPPSPPGIASFLPGTDDPHYWDILVELVRCDMELRQVHALPARLEGYLRMFPHLAHRHAALRQVAFEDYRLRFSCGETIEPDDYARRYRIDTSDWPLWDSNMQSPVAVPDSLTGTRSGHADRDSSGNAARDGQLPEIGQRFLQFEIVGELGRGAMGRVYLARQGDLANRFVALKVTTEPTPEPQHLAELQHSNIVPIYSLHQKGELQAVCMPFLGVATLSDLLRYVQDQPDRHKLAAALIGTVTARRASTVAQSIRKRPQQGGGPPSSPPIWKQRPLLEPLDRLSYEGMAVWLCAKVAAGLSFAHDHGIIHRDLKPGNILISDAGEPLILDFHLSKAADNRSDSIVGGTLPYMSPEHLRSLQTGCSVDERSDVFSLGVILFELLTGDLPYPTQLGNLDEIVACSIEDRRRVPGIRAHCPGVAPAVESIVHRCLAFEPAGRYVSAAQLQVDLERHLQHLPLRHASNRSLPERARKWIKRHPRLTSASSIIAASTLLLAALLAGLVTRSSQLNELRGASQRTIFQRELEQARTPLTVFAVGGPALHNSIRQAEGVLQQYDALDSDRWQERPFYRRGDTLSREEMEDNIIQLRYWLAAAILRQADQTTDRSARVAHLQQATSINELAQAVASRRSNRRALISQQADLQRRAGRAEQAEQLDAQAGGLALNGVLDQQLWAAELALRGQLEAAVRVLCAVLPQAPFDYLTWFRLGNAYAGLGQFERADACFSTCIALCPQSEWGVFQRGMVRLDSQQFAEAIADFDRAIELQPLQPEAHFNRGLALKELGQWSPAEQALTRALELGASETRIYFVRSDVRKQLGDEQGAQADYAEALQRKPSDELSWVSRGYALAREKPDEALHDFEQALRLNPRSVPALQNTAAVLSEQLGRTAEAIEFMTRLIQLRPQDPEAVATRGVLYARTGHRRLAHEDAARALQLSQDANTLYLAADIYALTSTDHPQDADLAIDYLGKSAWEDPQLVLGLLAIDPDIKPLQPLEAYQSIARRLAAFHDEVGG